MSDRRPVRNGVDGLDGASAFEIAKVHGFAGSQQEWLASLKGLPGQDAAPVDWQAVVAAIANEAAKHPGPKGDQGERGYRGERGPIGAPGHDGIDGKDGELPQRSPWQGTFHIDEETGRTLRLDLESSDAALRPWSILPVRRADGRMTHAQILPS